MAKVWFATNKAVIELFVPDAGILIVVSTIMKSLMGDILVIESWFRDNGLWHPQQVGQ